MKCNANKINDAAFRQMCLYNICHLTIFRDGFVSIAVSFLLFFLKFNVQQANWDCFMSYIILTAFDMFVRKTGATVTYMDVTWGRIEADVCKWICVCVDISRVQTFNVLHGITLGYFRIAILQYIHSGVCVCVWYMNGTACRKSVTVLRWCLHKIRLCDVKEYLIIEWRNGDMVLCDEYTVLVFTSENLCMKLAWYCNFFLASQHIWLWHIIYFITFENLLE